VNETEFLRISQALLDSLEQQADRWQDVLDADLETERSDNVVTFSIRQATSEAGTAEKNTVYIIVNSQAATQEIWLAAPGGGFHYRWQDAQWQDTRGGPPLEAALSRVLSQACGQTVDVSV